MQRVFLTGLAGLLLSGCVELERIRDPERSKQVTGIDKHSAFPVTRRLYFERVNLIELVDPESAAETAFPTAWQRAVEVWQNASSEDDRVNSWGARYDLVLAWFRQRRDITDDQKRKIRNSIQERILSVSMSRCNVFKTYLRRDQADRNFALGSLTTAAGVLGAVLQGATASRNLAGAAGLFSGIRSEYNQEYYANLAAHVIVRGIETKQELVYRHIQTEGQSKNIDDYPLEAAVKDAVYWDGLCSVVVGLDQAAASVDATTEPGLDAATRTMLRARLAKEALDLPSDQLLKPDVLEKIGLAGSRLGMSLVGSVRGDAAAKDSQTDIYAVSAKLSDQVQATVATAANEVQSAVTKRRTELQSKTATAKNAAAGTTDNSVSDAFKKAVAAKIVDPLALDRCYTALGAKALQDRSDAVKKRDDAAADLKKSPPPADADAKKVAADFAVKDAERRIQEARDKIQQVQDLASVDIDTYKKQRLAAAASTQDVTKLTDMKTLFPDPENKASAGKGCAAAAS